MSENQKFIIVLNFSNKRYKEFKMGIEENSIVKEVFNSDLDIYFGSNITNENALFTNEIPCNNLNFSVKFDIAPFSGIVFEVIEIKSTK